MEYASCPAAALILAALFCWLCYWPPYTQGRVVNGDPEAALPLSNQLPAEDGRSSGTEARLCRESTLGQVLAEMLADVETVERAGLPCADRLRHKHAVARHALVEQTRRCLASGDGKKDVKAAAQCVENETRELVSDVRLLITKLKDCVDHS